MKAVFNLKAALAVAGLLFLYISLELLRTYWTLRHIPGPFWPRFTNLARVWWVKTTRSHEIHMQMHEQYGDYVRLGPKMISISDPNAIPIIYPIRPGLPKSNFYRAMMPYTRKGNALPLVFNTRDENLHKHLKKPIAPLFSLSNVLSFEKFVDQILDSLFRQLDQRFTGHHVAFELGDWLQFFAFEVMAMMSFSRQYGFLEHGRDEVGLLGAIWNYMKAAAPVTQIPWFDIVWNKNPLAALLRPTTAQPIMNVVLGKINERQKEIGDDSQKSPAHTEGDFLSQFISVQHENQHAIPKWAVTAWTFSNVIAGSDTTSVAMKTLWYHLLTHPTSMHCLYNELVNACLSRPYPEWNQISSLPYLDACVNEALRLHPPFCLPFERVVPPEGMVIDGHFLPGKTVVGMNPWVVNRHKPTFGEDADAWRPERWLGDNEHHRKMKNTLLTFGAGRRVCLGKHIAILELKKLTSALLLNYEIDIVNPDQYTVDNHFFFRQQGLMATIRKRE